MPTKKFGHSPLRSSFAIIFIIFSVYPIFIDIVVERVDIAWYFYFVAPLILGGLLQFRIREYHHITLTDKSFSANNLFRSRYDATFAFDDIKFIDVVIPRGQYNDIYLMIFTRDNKAHRVFLLLLDSKTQKELFKELLKRGVLMNRTKIDHLLGSKNTPSNVGRGSKITELYDRASLKVFKPEYSLFLKSYIITSVVMVVILTVLALFFRKEPSAWLMMVVTALILTGIGFLIHNQESYIAISKERLFSIGRGDDRTHSIHLLSNIESIYLNKAKDGLYYATLFCGGNIYSFDVSGVDKEVISRLSTALAIHNIELLRYDKF